MYDYEMRLYDNMLNGVKWQWVLKATGLGLTEYYLRKMIHLATHKKFRPKFQNSQMCIVVGPNLDLGKKVMRRLRFMFNSMAKSKVLTMLRPFVLDGTAKETVIRDVTVTVFPSNHLDAMRGLPNVSFILIDEGDFFKPSEQLNVLTVSTRYVAKSSVWIAMISTPGEPGGLFETIEKDKNSPFHKEFFNYKWGMQEHNANLFTERMIDDAKRHRMTDFDREYDLQYKGFTGNLFSVEFLFNLQQKSEYYKVIEPVESFDEVTRVRNINLRAFEEFVRGENPVQYYRLMGLDPGYSSSKFGVSVGQVNLKSNVFEVVYEAQFSAANSREMIDLVTYLVKVLSIRKVAVDRSDVDFIRNIKDDLRDYDHVDFTEMKKEELDDLIYDGDMVICPITFNVDNKRAMLYHMRDLIYGDFVRIHPDIKIHYNALSTINVKDNMSFNKKEVVGDDVLDAFCAMLKLVHFGH